MYFFLLSPDTMFQLPIQVVNHPHSKQVSAGLFSFFVSALFLEILVCLPVFWPDEAAQPGQASLGSHRIPCPITGRRGLKRGRITLSQQTTGNRKTESAASRRSSQPSTISHGLIGLHLHLLYQNRSFRSGLVCRGFRFREVYTDLSIRHKKVQWVVNLDVKGEGHISLL